MKKVDEMRKYFIIRYDEDGEWVESKTIHADYMICRNNAIQFSKDRRFTASYPTNLVVVEEIE